MKVENENTHALSHASSEANSYDSIHESDLSMKTSAIEHDCVGKTEHKENGNSEGKLVDSADIRLPENDANSDVSLNETGETLAPVRDDKGHSFTDDDYSAVHGSETEKFANNEADTSTPLLAARVCGDDSDGATADNVKHQDAHNDNGDIHKQSFEMSQTPYDIRDDKTNEQSVFLEQQAPEHKDKKLCIDKKKCNTSRTKCDFDEPPDGGWGWVVTFSAFMVGVILDGISFSFGLFFKDLYTYFGESKSVTSCIISVMNGTYLGIGPIASVLVAMFGCRKIAMFGAMLAAVSFFMCTWSPNVHVMIILYGLFGGAGLGLLYLPSIVTVGHYFKEKRALATGIAVCGSGIGGFVFAPLSEFLIEYYSWKGAMWIISAIVLNGVVVAASYRPLKGHGGKRNRRKASDAKRLLNNGNCDSDGNAQKCCDIYSMFDFELLRSPTFLLYGCSCFLCMLGFFIPFTYIPDLAEEFGMTSRQSAMVISIIGILNTVARVGVGWVADRTWADALLINSVALVIGGVATMFVPTYNNSGLLATYAVVFGVSIAVFVSLRSIIVAELLGIEKLTSSFGLVTMCQGLSAFIGAPIAGALSDMSGNYRDAFYLAGIAIALSGVICFPLRRISNWETRHRSQKPVHNGNVFTSDISIDVKV